MQTEVGLIDSRSLVTGGFLSPWQLVTNEQSGVRMSYCLRKFSCRYSSGFQVLMAPANGSGEVEAVHIFFQHGCIVLFFSLFQLHETLLPTAS